MKLYGRLQFYVGKPERLVEFPGVKEILGKFNPLIVAEVKTWLGHAAEPQQADEIHIVPQFKNWKQPTGFLGISAHHLFLFANRYKDNSLVLGVYYKDDGALYSTVGFFATLSESSSILPTLKCYPS